MPVTRVVCPSCQAGLKSATGFKVGQKIRCPKCQGVVTVPEPELEVIEDGTEDSPPPAKKKPLATVADDTPRKKPKKAAVIDDDDEERPKKRKKKASGSYKTSPVRFVILGVLLVVLGVLGYMLLLKKDKDNEAIEHNNRVKAKQVDEDEETPPNSATQKAVAPK